jgi:hypothetical protein
MNEVAQWARERGWMHYPGEECIPHEVSLIEKLLTGAKGAPSGYTVLGGRA